MIKPHILVSLCCILCFGMVTGDAHAIGLSGTSGGGISGGGGVSFGFGFCTPTNAERGLKHDRCLTQEQWDAKIAAIPKGCPVPDKPDPEFLSPAQDNNFRDECLKADPNKPSSIFQPVFGAQPKDCMPAKSTPKIAPAQDLVSPSYLESAGDFKKYRPPGIEATIYRGSYNLVEGSTETARNKDNMIRGENNCREFTGDPAYVPLSAKGARDMQSHCAQQHILLYRASNPFKMLDPNGLLRNITVRNIQPFFLMKLSEDEQEYNVSYYLRMAAQKVGLDPTAIPDGLIPNDLACRHPDLEGHCEDGAVLGERHEAGYASHTCTKAEIDSGNCLCRKEELVVASGTYKGEYGPVTNKCIKGETYERIFDPTHPYSPRFDMHDQTDREKYRSLAAIYGYGKDPDGNPSPPECAVACAAVDVDILTNRGAWFDNCMGSRVRMNLGLYLAYTLVFQISPDQAKEMLPCSTRFDVPDPDPEVCMQGGDGTNVDDAFLGCLRATERDENGNDKPKYSQSECIALADAVGKGAQVTIKQCCHATAQPIAGINTLKLRTGNKKNFPTYGGGGSGDNASVPEGFGFCEWFGEHKPYMRWWDTGVEAGGESDISGDEIFYRTQGSMDAIVGVGQDYGNIGAKDQLGRTCRIGGDGKDDFVKGEMQGISAWDGLVLYQARAQREFHLNGLARYEQIFKIPTGENFALTMLGGSYQALVRDIKDRSARREDPNKVRTEAWPLAWRGYASGVGNEAFPYLFDEGKTSGAITRGLDTAVPGSIVIWRGQSSVAGKQRLPALGVVTEVHKASAKISTSSVKVEDFNAGKFPDICGNTDALGTGAERTLFKDKLPDNVEGDFFKVGSYATKTCDDPALRACVEPLWNQLEVYHPILDVRGGEPATGGGSAKTP